MTQAGLSEQTPKREGLLSPLKYLDDSQDPRFKAPPSDEGNEKRHAAQLPRQWAIIIDLWLSFWLLKWYFPRLVRKSDWQRHLSLGYLGQNRTDGDRFLQFYAPNWNIKPSVPQPSAKSVPNLCIFAQRPLIRGWGIKTGLKAKLWPALRPTFSFTLCLLCCCSRPLSHSINVGCRVEALACTEWSGRWVGGVVVGRLRLGHWPKGLQGGWVVLSVGPTQAQREICIFSFIPLHLGGVLLECLGISVFLLELLLKCWPH